MFQQDHNKLSQVFILPLDTTPAAVNSSFKRRPGTSLSDALLGLVMCMRGWCGRGSYLNRSNYLSVGGLMLKSMEMRRGQQEM